MTNKKSNDSRRKLLKSIAAGSGAVVAGKALPESWSKPVVDAVMLPAHAETTNELCGDSVVSNTTYTQSSVYTSDTVESSSTAATNGTMTNGAYDEISATGTSNGADEWVKMDLGAVYDVCSVVVGCDLDSTLRGGWGPKYTENRNVQYSTNGSDWSTAFNTGTFGSQGIKTHVTSFSARYIRIVNSGGYSNYLAVTEFYALVMA